MRSSLLIGGAMVIVVALVGWQLMPAPRPPPVEAGPVPVAAVAPPAPAMTGALLPPTPVATPIAVVLSGVVTGIDRQQLAIVSVDRGPVSLLRVGDSINGSSHVLRIDGESMTYRQGGSDVRVFVSAGPGTPAVAAPAAAQVKTYPGFVAAAPSIARASGTEPGSGNEAFRQAVDKKLQAIAAGR